MKFAKEKLKELILVMFVGVLLISMSGCASMHMTAKQLESQLYGLSVTVRTFDEESQVIDKIRGVNQDRGTPFINSMVNSFKNITTGTSKVVLIRSQNGTPLATYTGNQVSVFSVDIPKTTALLVDGKVLLVYRCDYTIYDTALLLD